MESCDYTCMNTDDSYHDIVYYVGLSSCGIFVTSPINCAVCHSLVQSAVLISLQFKAPRY